MKKRIKSTYGINRQLIKSRRSFIGSKRIISDRNE